MTLKSFLNNLKIIPLYIFKILIGHKMPVWLSILMAAVSAWIVYSISPQINKSFKEEETRQSIISRNIDEINSKVINISINIRRLIYARQNKLESYNQLQQETLDLITNLQWRFIDIHSILDRDENKSDIINMSNSLEELRLKIINLDHEEDRKPLLLSLEKFSQASRQTIDNLYVEAKIKRSS